MEKEQRKYKICKGTEGVTYDYLVMQFAETGYETIAQFWSLKDAKLFIQAKIRVY